MKKGQVSFEYMIIIGFITVLIVGLMSVAFFYNNLVKDKIRNNQINSCMDKLVSVSESVYYSGPPSKATITCYFPENLKDLSIQENNFVVTFGSSSGVSKVGYQANAELNQTSNVINQGGLKKIVIEYPNKDDGLVISSP